MRAHGNQGMEFQFTQLRKILGVGTSSLWKRTQCRVGWVQPELEDGAGVSVLVP